VGVVASGVEGDLAAQVLDSEGVLLVGLLDQVLDQRVVVVDVGLVVLLVVHLEDLAGQNRLQGVVAEAQLRKSHWNIFVLHLIRKFRSDT
jgi:hypothetical protein